MFGVGTGELPERYILIIARNGRVLVGAVFPFKSA